MSVFCYVDFVHTKARSVLHWIYKVVVRKPEKKLLVSNNKIYSYLLHTLILSTTSDAGGFPSQLP